MTSIDPMVADRREQSRAVLVVEDDPAAGRLLEMGLRPEGFAVRTCASAAAALDVLGHDSDIGVVLTDLNLGGPTGIDLCKRVVELKPDVLVIVVTAFGNLETAIAAIRAGAYDFIVKPFEMEAVAFALERAFRHRDLGLEVRRLRAEVAETRGASDLLGQSAVMLQLRALLQRAGSSDAGVIITGESGTGKELAARALHAAGRRANGPFVVVNCAALPDALLESELFGHARGAFTDAKAAKVGLFLEADQGILFLDEIGDLPLAVQPKLLRALESRTVRPVGTNTEFPFDARVISATNRDLELAVEEGRFREDLFYRLNVIQIAMPPLRARGGDVLVLAQHFVETFAARHEKPISGLSRGAARKLMDYPWPGNVRELRNCIERAVALSAYDSVAAEDLPEKIRDYQSRHVIVAGEDPSELVELEEVEKRYILQVLRATGGNKAVAARVLGVNRKTLYRKLASYGLDELEGTPSVK